MRNALVLITFVLPGCTLAINPVKPPVNTIGEGEGEGAGHAGEGEGAVGGEGEGEGAPANTACGVIQSRCVSCHTTGGFVPDLSTSVIEAGTLVGEHSTAYPSEIYIVANNATNSFLMKKILGTQPSSEGLQMPSGAPPLSQAEQDLVTAWINAGAPGSDCSGVTQPAPIQLATPSSFNYAPSSSCSTHYTYVGGTNDGSRDMSPGTDCISCHQQTGGEAPLYDLMGTVFMSLHDADNCQGLGATNYQVFIDVLDPTTAAVLFSVKADNVGNFDSGSNSAPSPYRAQVRLFDPATQTNVATSAMQTPQTIGSCNSCHTAAANGPTANDIPLGRITISP